MAGCFRERFSAKRMAGICTLDFPLLTAKHIGSLARYQSPPYGVIMPNRKQVRAEEFEMHKEWARKQTTEDLKKWLENADRLKSGGKAAAREILRERGELED